MKFPHLVDFPLEGIFTCISALLNWPSSISEKAKVIKRSLILENLSQMVEWNSFKPIAGVNPESDEIILILADRDKKALPKKIPLYRISSTS